jgi:hypothetical protein
MLPTSVRARPERPDDRRPVHRDELVFFGRLEARKGLEVFCEALGLLTADELPGINKVTFLGRPDKVHGCPAAQYIARNADRWPWAYTIRGDFDQAQAITYLREHSRLAVMPSLVDNSPNTVLEAIALGVPFIASRSGGAGELIAVDDLAGATFDICGVDSFWPRPLAMPSGTGDARALAAALRRRLGEPAVSVRPSADAEANDEDYSRWHARLAAARRTQTADGDCAGRLSATVCLATRDDGEGLRLVMSALRAQDAEVVVVDEASTDPDAIAAVADVEADAAVPARVFRLPTPHRADARQAAADAAHGELLIFVGPDAVPGPDLVRTATQVAARTGADVLTFPVLDGRDGPASVAVPVAGPPLAGLLYPALVVGPYAIRRDALARLGGFAPDARGDEADHELLARAALEGMHLEVVPVALAASRHTDRADAARDFRWRDDAPAGYAPEQRVRVARAARSVLPESLAEMPELVEGYAGRAHAVEDGHPSHFDEVVAAYEARLAEFGVYVDTLEATAAQLRTDRSDLLLKLAQVGDGAQAQGPVSDGRPHSGAPGRRLARRLAGKVRARLRA